jgi:hypothetical protein
VFTLAIAADAVVQVPPALPEVVREMEFPTHTPVGPEMVPAVSTGITVMLVVVVSVPQVAVDAT